MRLQSAPSIQPLNKDCQSLHGPLTSRMNCLLSAVWRIYALRRYIKTWYIHTYIHSVFDIPSHCHEKKNWYCIVLFYCICLRLKHYIFCQFIYILLYIVCVFSYKLMSCNYLGTIIDFVTASVSECMCVCLFVPVQVLSAGLMLLAAADIIYRGWEYLVGHWHYPAHLMAPFITFLAMVIYK